MKDSPIPSVLALGELLWDLLPTGKLLGGAPANCCFRLRQLGVNARMVSRIGSDALGDEMESALRAKGFDLSLVQHDPEHPTGTVDVCLSASGSPDFTITQDVAYDYLELTDELLAAARQSSLICFGTLIQRASQARATVQRLLDTSSHAARFLDINLRKDCYSLETVTASLERATILKLNSEEVSAVCSLLGAPAPNERAGVEYLLRTFPLSVVLVTRGEDGAFALSREGEEVTVPGIRVKVVDTIGSGDSCSAGFISQYVRGETLAQCVYFGNINGALNASRRGGMPDISASDLEEFATAHPMRS